MFHGENRRDQFVITVDRARFAGEPVALVVAETRDAAEKVAREVDFQELNYITNQDEAGEEGAPLVHDKWPRNEYGELHLIYGDAESVLATAAVVDTRVYHSPTASHAALEPHVSPASWTDDGQLETWSGTQAPNEVRKRVAGIFRV